MTTPAEIAASLSSGAARAVMAMTGEWARHTIAPDLRSTLGIAQLINFCPGERSYTYRLKPLGQQVKGVLLKIEQETKP